MEKNPQEIYTTKEIFVNLSRKIYLQRKICNVKISPKVKKKQKTS